MPPKKGRGRGRGQAKGKGSYSSWNDGGWGGWGGDDDYHYAYGSSGKGKGKWDRGTRSDWQKGYGKGETRDQFLDRLMWEDNSSRAWSEKEELAEIVACRVRTDLGLDEDGSSKSYDDDGMENADEDHVSKSRRIEKRRLHKQKQRANATAKLESYEDLEARMEHMESLVRGHFDEEPDRALTRDEWDAIARDSAKKASDAREFLRLKKKEEDELREKAKAKASALAIAETPSKVSVQAHKTVDSPIDDVFGALGGDMDEAVPDVQAEVCLYIRKLLTLANDHEILKGATYDVTPDTNALCQRMANEVHRDVLPGDSHVAAMESLKDEFGLRTSATTTPGLLRVMFVAMANRKIRVQRRLLGLGAQPQPQRRR